jgi:hypothetical protein
MTNMGRIFLTMLVGLVFFLFSASISMACTPTGLNPANPQTWAPNATVGAFVLSS